MDGTFWTQKPLGGWLEELCGTTTVRIDFATHHCTLSPTTHQTPLDAEHSLNSQTSQLLQLFSTLLNVLPKNQSTAVFSMLFFFLFNSFWSLLKTYFAIVFLDFFFHFLTLGIIQFCSVLSVHWMEQQLQKNRTDERNNTPSVDEKNCSDWLVGSLSTQRSYQTRRDFLTHKFDRFYVFLLILVQCNLLLNFGNRWQYESSRNWNRRNEIRTAAEDPNPITSSWLGGVSCVQEMCDVRKSDDDGMACKVKLCFEL